MNKQLILGVSCADDFASDVPTVFAVQIDGYLSARIKSIAAAVKDLGVFSVADQYFAGVWSTSYVDASDATGTGGMSAVLEAIESDSAPVELSMIHVDEHSFYFTSIPKHAGDSLALSTKPVAIACLDNEEPLLSL